MDRRPSAADPPTPDESAPPCAARRPSATSRALADVSIGTVSKALNNSGRLRQETRDKVHRVATRARLPAERPRPEPAPRPDLHRRAHLQRQLRPLHLPDRRGAGGAPRRQRHRGLHVQRHRRSGARARSISTSCSASASTASSSPPGAPTSAPPLGAARPRTCRCSTSSRRPTIRDALSPCARRRGRRGARGRASRRARPPAHRPHHRPGALRGVRLRRDGYRKALARSRARRAATASICPASGRRTGAARRWRSSSTASTRRPDAHLLRQRPDRPRRRRCAARARHRRAGRRRDRRLRQLGDRWPTATRPPLTSVDMNLKRARPRSRPHGCST